MGLKSQDQETSQLIEWRAIMKRIVAFLQKKIDSVKGEMMSIGFGSGKRSYVMCPYTLVKDNDSGYETSNVDAILDGEISELLEKNIRR